MRILNLCVQRYASAVYVMARCLSVHLSQAGVLSKWLAYDHANNAAQ